MKLGLSTYTLTWSVGVPGYDPPLRPLTAEALVGLTRESGLGLLQIADNLPLHAMTDEALLRLKQTADAHRVELEVGTRGTDPELLLRYLGIAGLLGSSLVRTLATTPDLAAAEAQIRQVLPDFEAAGVTLAIENHGLHTTGQLVQLFQNLRSARVGCCLDTVNSFGALEAPDHVIRALSPYLVNLHVKDFEIKRADHMMGFSILGTAAGAGRLDIPGLKAIAGASGKPGVHAILELWTPYAGSVEETIAVERRWMEESLAYLRRVHFTEEEDSHYATGNVEREGL
ncbi:TIM barrel protein [Paenibacillus sp. MWE-103]|uniref:TIM barrel protein n=1 Tax=Paenibacillus artemisiicola TaxID=1172618 RepID=A0ABS3W8D3_9BACL|nr:TIM barrel protein [Paenibacillus artemisiicola]MBO7744574.1 TIM barrel protein [Paenibacillus artemisiicola]